MTTIAIVISILACLLLGRWIFVRVEARQRAAGTFANRYVMVLDDGTARELNESERNHLNGEYRFGDGDRPYVKPRYVSLTPDGRMSGYLRRNRLPRGTDVQQLTSKVLVDVR
jgi:hypothetical protein